MDNRCAVCGSSRLARGFTLREDGLTLLRCEQCTFVFLRVEQSDAVRHGRAYHTQRQLGADLVVKTMDATGFLAFWSSMLGLRPGTRLLDVGCAEGLLLQVAGCMGFVAEGIDVTDFYSSHWRRACIDARVASAEEHSRSHSAAFKLITSRQVIEHVRDPLSFLRACAEMLEPDGHCLIETGDPSAWQVRLEGGRWNYWIPSEGKGAHVSFISRRAAEVLGERVGLRLLDSISHARYRSFDSYAREQGGRSRAPRTLVKYALHRSRLSADRCLWYHKPRGSA
jgi:SAM-dependent methyltransferase